LIDYCHPHALTRTQSGCTALIYAAANGHADCARLLLDAGADKNAKDVVRDCFAVSAAVRVFVLVLDAW
jgi:ankyrin repeat protein